MLSSVQGRLAQPWAAGRQPSRQQGECEQAQGQDPVLLQARHVTWEKVPNFFEAALPHYKTSIYKVPPHLNVLQIHDRGRKVMIHGPELGHGHIFFGPNSIENFFDLITNI